MENKAVYLLALLALFTGTAFCANAHMVSYRIDPSSVRPGEDFDLYLTFKSDVEYSVDSLDISLSCPPEFQCTNISATLPPYGIQEFIFPVRSTSGDGIKTIGVGWNDGSSRFIYDGQARNLSSEKILYSGTVIVNVQDRSFTNFTSTSELFANENTDFRISFDSSRLHNVQVSLYSSCISFDRPIFYFQEVSGSTLISSPAFVNCREGNSDVVFSLSSDELSYATPLGVRVAARPRANLSASFNPSEHLVGKDYILVTLENTGATAEKLSVAALPNSAVGSSDVVYLGDFNGQKLAVFEIESKKAGTYPFEVEARWTEGKETFVKTFCTEVKFIDRDLGLLIPASVILCALVLLWLLKRR